MDYSKFIENFQARFDLNEIDQLARQTEFVKRAPKKIVPINFLVSLFLTLFNAKNTYSSVAKNNASLIGDTVSKQAVFKRTNGETVEWLKSILALVLIKTSQIKYRNIYNKDIFKPFNRVILNDSTNISVPAKLYEFFGGCINQSKKVTSTLKIQGYFNILKEQFCHFEITPYRKNDQSAAHDIFDIAQRNDLIIRDLGYFSIAVFKKIVENSVYFLSRLRANVTIYINNGNTKLDLLSFLKTNISLEYIDINIMLSEKWKLPVRLVANKLPDDIAKERRRKAKKNHDRRCNISKENLELLGWEIYITNILPSVWDAKTICDVYRLRWRIEIIFKSWKSFFQIDEVPQGKLEQVECHIYMTLIMITLFHSHLYIRTVEIAYLSHNVNISLLKFYKFFKEQSWKITHLFTEQNGLRNFIKSAVYYCAYEKRKKRKSYPQSIFALG